MATAEPLALIPVPTAFDNAADWDDIARQIESEAGLPTQVTPDILGGMIGSAAALLFAADAAGNMSPLRGTFADPVIAQCQRNAGCFNGAQPTSIGAHLLGSHLVDGHPVLRVRLSVALQAAADNRQAETQFWDLQLGGELTVGQSTCPNCGGPIAQGGLVCSHCGTDVRGVVSVPIVVVKLELY
jgi:hypothetical protein